MWVGKTPRNPQAILERARLCDWVLSEDVRCPQQACELGAGLFYKTERGFGRQSSQSREGSVPNVLKHNIGAPPPKQLDAPKVNPLRCHILCPCGPRRVPSEGHRWGTTMASLGGWPMLERCRPSPPSTAKCLRPSQRLEPRGDCGAPQSGSEGSGRGIRGVSSAYVGAYGAQCRPSLTMVATTPPP